MKLTKIQFSIVGTDKMKTLNEYNANTLITKRVREWYNGSIVAFQAIDPGSTPGSRSFFLLFCYNTHNTSIRCLFYFFYF